MSGMEEMDRLIQNWKVCGSIGVTEYQKFLTFAQSNDQIPFLSIALRSMNTFAIQEFRRLNDKYLIDAFMKPFLNFQLCSDLKEMIDCFFIFKKNIDLADNESNYSKLSYLRKFEQLVNQIPYVKELDHVLQHFQNQQQAELSLAEAVAIILKNPNAAEILKGMEIMVTPQKP